ncbi:MAG TPA: T9SS type A sorting domain-containing protein, partial [bacterium]|nr:T9SS type A sorting domain-containing protein [bacterium]
WPQPNRWGSEQHIDYGMDPKVCNDARYKDKITEALLAIPTISFVTGLEHLFDRDTGIFMNAFGRGRDWERPASVELINPDGSEGFQIDAGIRMRGGWSRHPDNPKHAFRIFFRGEYGSTKLRFPLFGDEGVSKFDKVDLRTSQNYSWAYKGEGNDTGRHNTMIREVFARDTQRDMGMPYTRSRYYHLYLNGVYWGLFQTQERVDADYAETYFGGDTEDYDVIKKDPERGGIEANDGNLDAWHRLWEIARRGFNTDADYYLVQGRNPDGSRNPASPVLVDLDNLICYMISVYYTGDFDSPISAFSGNTAINNLFALYNRARQDGFKFFRHDAEHSLFLQEGGIPGAGIDRTGPYRCGETRDQFNPQWLHQQLANHPVYRLRFADWVYRFFFDGGALTPEAVTRRLEERRDQIETAIIAESARWGDSKVSQPRTYHKDWLPAVEFLIDTYAPIRTEMVLNQFRDKGWFPDVPAPRISHTTGMISGGEVITLTAEGEGIIYYTLDGSDPYLPLASENSSTYALIEKTATKYALVPKSNIGSAWSLEKNFDTSGWHRVSGAPGGIGYEAGTGFENLISLDLRQEMYDPDGSNPGANTSCYVRIPFTVDATLLPTLTSLTFTSQFDDGIVVYLNGTKILENNVPPNPAWNGTASGPIDSEMEEKTFDVSAHVDRLVAGDNLLAIHALNTSRQSSDFLVTAKLTASDRQTGGVSPSARAYTGGIAITESGRLNARVMGNRGWSPLAGIRLWVREEVRELRISEIHYHPLNLGNDINHRELEFIELQNMGVSDYDLGGVRFTRGISYEFPAGTTLAAGGFIVLASNREYFISRYGFAPAGQYEGQLDNSGERVVLENADGDTLVDMRYGNTFPWPVSANGGGYSMVIRSPLPGVDPAVGTNWKRSAEIHGSPGAKDIATSVRKDPQAETGTPSFMLYQNYPNPFNPQTALRFDMPVSGRVTLTIHNILGQEIARLADGVVPAGQHEIVWDARNQAGGIYICRIESRGFTATRKLILMR